MSVCVKKIVDKVVCLYVIIVLVLNSVKFEIVFKKIFIDSESLEII
jgi:hypothetical protein